MAKETGATIISPNHPIATKFKYDGSDHLSKPYSSADFIFRPLLKDKKTNRYYLAEPGKKSKMIWNFTIDNQGRFIWSWDEGGDDLNY